MIHDKARAEALRARTAAQLNLIKSLQAKIAKGKLEALEVAQLQTEDIETFFLNNLERKDRTPAEEAQWLSYAEQMLLTWGPYLQEANERFSKFGGKNIEVIG
jgi:hypothetical protein